MMNDFVTDLYPDGAHELVKVFTTASEFEALLVQGLLHWAGIENVLTWLDPLPRTVHPTAAGAMIRVLQRDAGDALSLIEEYRKGEIQFELDPDFEEPPEANY
jgi:hypothetical protein